MDGTSLARPARPSTHSVLAGEHLCDQVAALLLIEPKVCRQAFLGEPAREVLAMAEWALGHEGEAGFDPQRNLPAWARKRGRGFSAKLRVRLARYRGRYDRVPHGAGCYSGGLKSPWRPSALGA